MHHHATTTRCARSHITTYRLWHAVNVPDTIQACTVSSRLTIHQPTQRSHAECCCELQLQSCTCSTSRMYFTVITQSIHRALIHVSQHQLAKQISYLKFITLNILELLINIPVLYIMYDLYSTFTRAAARGNKGGNEHMLMSILQLETGFTAFHTYAVCAVVKCCCRSSLCIRHVCLTNGRE